MENQKLIKYMISFLKQFTLIKKGDDFYITSSVEKKNGDTNEGDCIKYTTLPLELVYLDIDKVPILIYTILEGKRVSSIEFDKLDGEKILSDISLEDCMIIKNGKYHAGKDLREYYKV